MPDIQKPSVGRIVPSVGRIVHYVMPSGEHRPAIIVQVWEPESGLVNLQVFTDGPNDDMSLGITGPNDNWRGSVPQYHGDPLSAPQNTWHWPERV